MNALDQSVKYLSTHWLIPGACFLWFAFLIAGIEDALYRWRQRRIMKRFAPRAETVITMFSEDVVLGGLKAGPSWFVSAHLLRMDSKTGTPEDAEKQIGDGNDLRYERAEQSGKMGFRFWQIE